MLRPHRQVSRDLLWKFQINMLACGGALEQIPIKCRLLYHDGMSGISLQPLLLQVAVVSDHARDRWFAIGSNREFVQGEKERNSGESDPKATLVAEKLKLVQCSSSQAWR